MPCPPLAPWSRLRPWVGVVALAAACGSPLRPPVAPTPHREIAVVRVPAGTYEVGCTPGQGDACDADEHPHRVTLTRAFWVMQTEVTQALWMSVQPARPWDSPPQGGFGGVATAPCAVPDWEQPNYPAYCVTWQDAVAFANALSVREGREACYKLGGPEVRWPKGPACRGWRLPTEAEWEVAARGGGDPLFAGEGPPESLGWTLFNSGRRLRPVGALGANGYGLHDMSGNVQEWVWDVYAAEPGRARVDPLGPSGGGLRVLRGGSWYEDEAQSRVASRFNREAPEHRGRLVGLRLVRTAP